MSNSEEESKYYAIRKHVNGPSYTEFLPPLMQLDEITSSDSNILKVISRYPAIKQGRTQEEIKNILYPLNDIKKTVSPSSDEKWLESFGGNIFFYMESKKRLKTEGVNSDLDSGSTSDKKSKSRLSIKSVSKRKSNNKNNIMKTIEYVSCPYCFDTIEDGESSYHFKECYKLKMAREKREKERRINDPERKRRLVSRADRYSPDTYSTRAYKRFKKTESFVNTNN